MAKAIHSMLRVLDEARSIDFYERAFGMRVVDRFRFDGFTLVYLASEETPFELELTINEGRTEPYALGDGYGHIAFTVEDLDAEHARFAGAGLNPAPIKEMTLEGRRLARFFFVQDPDGYKIEVLERAGRYR
ncbi:MAG TPA: VOC family protein [Acidisphaera sp.]|nr:VOC family protein [Acidisphaera sp.]